MQIKAVYQTMFGELIEQPIPLPPSLVREGGEEKERGQSPLSKRLFPLSFEGEGDKGGEVNDCT